MGEDGGAGDERFQRAITAIDEANAADPNVLTVGGKPRPKELAHGEMVTDWVRRLCPDASEALLLAARAHHIKRWHSPRSAYPDGRKGYLRWRTDLHAFHANEVAAIMAAAGYDAETIARTQQIVRKQRLGRDPDVQVLEDAMCMVFLQTQLDDVSEKIDDEKLIDVLRKTWRKMSPQAQQLALTLDLSPRGLGLVRRALGVD